MSTKDTPAQKSIDQLLRYSEQRGAKGEGRAPLFFYNQVVVTTCRQEANHSPRFWNMVRAKAPSTEKAKTWLKEHGQILEEEV